MDYGPLYTIDEEPVLPETHPVIGAPEPDGCLDGFTPLAALGFNPDILGQFSSNYLSHAIQTRNHILSHHDILEKIRSDPFRLTPLDLIEAYEGSLELATQEWKSILHTFNTSTKCLFLPFSPYELVEREELTNEPFFANFPKDAFLLFTTMHLREIIYCINSGKAQETKYRDLQKQFYFLTRFPQFYQHDDYGHALRRVETKMKEAKRDSQWFDDNLKRLVEPVLEESRRLEEELRRIDEEVLGNIKLERMEAEVQRRLAAVEVMGTQTEVGSGPIGKFMGWISGQKTS